MLIAQNNNRKIQLPVDYPEEEDSDVMKLVMQDIASFQ